MRYGLVDWMSDLDRSIREINYKIYRLEETIRMLEKKVEKLLEKE